MLRSNFVKKLSLIFLLCGFQVWGEVSPYCEAILAKAVVREDWRSLPHRALRLASQDHFTETPSLDSFSVKGHPKVQAHVKVIADPQEGLLTKLLMIREADHTVDLSTFIFRQDEASYLILNELKKAIERGVSVRLLVDSLGSFHPFHNEYKALLQVTPGFQKDRNGNETTTRATVEIKTFNPVVDLKAAAADYFRSRANLFLPKQHQFKLKREDAAFFHRLHDKMVITDGEYGAKSRVLVGGRNVNNSYYAINGYDPAPYFDMELLVKGTAADPATRNIGSLFENYFNKLFLHTANRDVQPSIWKFIRNRHDRMFDEEVETASHYLSPTHLIGQKFQSMQNDAFLDEGFEEVRAKLLSEMNNIRKQAQFGEPANPKDSRDRRNGASVIENLMHLAKRAKKSIDLVSPYLYLTDTEIEYLNRWAKEDPSRKVRIFTSSILTSDAFLAQAMVDGDVAPRVQKIVGESNPQFEFYSYGKSDSEKVGGNKSYGQLHAKFAVIDGAISVVGSSNGDPVSRNLNSEVALQVKGEKTAERLSQAIEHLRENSYLWGTPEWHAIRVHPNSKNAMLLQNIATWMIRKFHLIPNL